MLYPCRARCVSAFISIQRRCSARLMAGCFAAWRESHSVAQLQCGAREDKANCAVNRTADRQAAAVLSAWRSAVVQRARQQATKTAFRARWQQKRLLLSLVGWFTWAARRLYATAAVTSMGARRRWKMSRAALKAWEAWTAARHVTRLTKRTADSAHMRSLQGKAMRCASCGPVLL